MRKNIAKLILGICVIGAFIRLYDLNQIPNSLSADEVAFGYNAYSILHTGRDEFGYFLPLSFRSFDDYKNPVFGYALIPAIAVFGLNDWSIRLVSALAGIGVIVLFFLISFQLTGSQRVSLLSAFFAGISPWLIQYSRVAIDMELALFFSLCAVFLLLSSRGRRGWFIPAIIFFGLSFYTYHSSKVWVPLILVTLLFFYKIFNRVVLAGVVIFILLLIPYFVLLKTSKIGLRPYAISVFSDQEEQIHDAELIVTDKSQGLGVGKLIHNRRFTKINQAINGYLAIFNPYIFFGQNRANHMPLSRLFYLWQMPLMVLGIFILATTNRRLFWLLIYWILIGLIPGGLTIYPPFDRRVLLVSFPLLLFVSLGLDHFVYRILIPQGFRKYLILVIIVVITASYAIYMHHYFIHGRDTVVDVWGNGMKEIVTEVIAEKQKYDRVLVSLKLNQTLNYFLFYEHFSPREYLSHGGTFYGGYLENGNRFDKYVFQFIESKDWAPQTLYVWNINEKQECLRPLKQVRMSDGQLLANIGILSPDLPDCLEWQKLHPEKRFK